MSAPELRPRYWPCGYCGAGSGAPCATLSGRVAERVHADRRESVHLWRRYGRRVGR